MTIAKSAVEAYLNRKIEKRLWLKELKPLEIEEELSYISPKPKFTAPLFHHQKICFLLGIAYPETIYMTDLGTGKSSIALELLSYFYYNKFIRRAFIFVPTNEVAEGWEDEINKWGFKIPFIRLTQKSSKAKWEVLSEFGDGLIIGTYIGIAAMSSELKQQKDDNPKRKRIPQKNLLEELFKDSDAVVFDQCYPKGTKIKTFNGELSIELLKKDDLVLSSDFTFRPIKKVYNKQSSVFSRLHLNNGNVIEVTPDHPFFTDLGWVCAGNLKGRCLYDNNSLRDLWKTVPEVPGLETDQKWGPTQNSILQCILLAELTGLCRIPTTTKYISITEKIRKDELEQRSAAPRISEEKT